MCDVLTCGSYFCGVILYAINVHTLCRPYLDTMDRHVNTVTVIQVSLAIVWNIVLP